MILLFCVIVFIFIFLVCLMNWLIIIGCFFDMLVVSCRKCFSFFWLEYMFIVVLLSIYDGWISIGKFILLINELMFLSEVRVCYFGWFILIWLSMVENLLWFLVLLMFWVDVLRMWMFWVLRCRVRLLGICLLVEIMILCGFFSLRIFIMCLNVSLLK